jgi:ComF family protein
MARAARMPDHCRPTRSASKNYRMPSLRPAPAFDRAAAVRGAKTRVLAWLRAGLPQACTLCAGPSGDALLCDGCAREMPTTVHACPVCASPSPAGFTCGACLAAPPAFAATIAAWRYAFPADRLLHALKYGGRLALAEPCADALAHAVRQRGAALPDRICAVPLSPARQRSRGFNHAQEIARRVSALTGIPLADALIRRGEAPPQAGLALAARKRNVRNAFAAVKRCDGLAVAIVDDVMTTGATLGAASTALRRAGARRVEAWVVARTPPPARSR